MAHRIVYSARLKYYSLLIGVFLWYISSILINIHRELNSISYPLTEPKTSQHYPSSLYITAIQFLVGSMTSFILIVFIGEFNILKSFPAWWRRGLIIGSLFYLELLSKNMFLTVASVTQAHTTKLLVPLLTIILSLTILKNKISFVSILYILLMMVGAFFSIWNDISFDFHGIIFAVVSNILISLHNLFIKITYNENQNLCGFHLFFISCLFGLFLSTIIHIFLSPATSNYTYDVFSLEIIQSSITFSIQHLMSYLLLSYMSFISHSIIYYLKRTLILLIYLFVLGMYLSIIQYFSICITITGFILYIQGYEKIIKYVSGFKGGSELMDLIKKCTSEHYKLILCIFLTTFSCIGVSRIYLRKRFSVKNVHAKAVWAFDAPINLISLEFVNNILDYNVNSLDIICFNAEKCRKSVDVYEASSLQIKVSQLQALELSKDTPTAAWMAAHPINKIKSLMCFSAYFQKMVFLSTLWKYGGIVIDLGVTVTYPKDVKGNIISSSLQGCILNENMSSAILCNFPPNHKNTQTFIEEISSSFRKYPKVCNFSNFHPYLVHDNIVASSDFKYSMPIVETKFGLVGYEFKKSLGEEMQSLAAAYILPHIEDFIDRKTFSNPSNINLTYISNAFWAKDGILFNNITNLTTIPAAIHITSSAYNKIKQSKSILTSISPIGARDLKSFSILINEGIEAVFTGCLTLWMKNPNLVTNMKRNNNTLVVDLKWEGNPLPRNSNNITYISYPLHNEVNSLNIRQSSIEYAFGKSFEKLIELGEAKVVVTSCIHVALPCVAMGTPVIFVLNCNLIWEGCKEDPPPRVTGLTDLFHTVDLYKMSRTEALNYLKNFNWESPPPNPNSHKFKLLKKLARRIIERSPEIAASLKVFELI